MSTSTQRLGIEISSNVSRALPGIRNTDRALEGLEGASNDAARGLDSVNGASGRAERNMRDLRNQTNNASTGFENLSGVLKGLGIGLSVGAVVKFGQQLIEITSKYEAFQAVLRNTLGAREAEASFNLIQSFAAKTPFQVDELTGSFIKLVNRGFKPTEAELTKIGDLAASQGKSFDQLTEAILDAQTGEFERLKEFGIKASQANGKVTLSFKDQTVQVEKNSAAVRNAVIAFGDLQGVAGSMAVVSETLGGKISNLSDNWDRFMSALGKNLLPVISAGVDILASDLELLNDSVEAIFKTLKNEGGVKEAGTEAYELAKKRLQSAKAAGENVLRGELMLMQQDLDANNKEIEKLVSQLATGGVKGSFNINQVTNRIDSLREINKATKDALDFFNKESSKVDKGTSFGSAATVKHIKTIKEVLDDLAKTLVGIDTQFAFTGGTVDKLFQSRASAISGAIKQLADLGVRPGDELFNKLKGQFDQLQSALVSTGSKITIPIELQPIAPASNAQTIAKLTKGLKQEFAPQLNTFTKELNALIQDSIQQGIGDIAAGIGEAFAGGGFKSVLNGFVNVLAGFGERLGKQLIVTGLAVTAFKRSLETLNGVPAILAGGALIAASSAFRSLTKSGVGAFATGGTVYGPQLALVGENAARKEHIIPQEVLDKMGNNFGELRVSLEGTQFVAWIERQKRLNG